MNKYMIQKLKEEIRQIISNNDQNYFCYYYLHEMLQFYNEFNSTDYQLYFNGLEMAVKGDNAGCNTNLLKFVKNCGFTKARDYHRNSVILISRGEVEVFDDNKIKFLSTDGYPIIKKIKSYFSKYEDFWKSHIYLK